MSILLRDHSLESFISGFVSDLLVDTEGDMQLKMKMSKMIDEDEG